MNTQLKRPTLLAFCALALCIVNLNVARAEETPYSPKIAKASDEGEQAIKAFRPAEGLKAELIAAEPLLANPVCMYIDNLNRIYVVETFRHSIGVDTGSMGLTLDQDLSLRNVPERIEVMKKKWGAEIEKFTKESDRIRLIDTSTSGKAVNATVFDDKCNGIPDGIGAGIVAFKGDVYFTCIPNVWKLRDTDGDGKADKREALSTGYGVHGGYLGHDLHGLCVGPDGKLYYSIGDRGLHVEYKGTTLDYPDMGAVLRCNPDGSELEAFATGLRNPQELAFDEYGNLFTGDNNSDAGDAARWVYIVEGSDTGWRNGYQYIGAPVARGPWNAELLWKPYFKGQAAYIVPPVANFANGPSGLCYYPGTGLPERYSKHFFLADFRGGANGSGIHSFANKPKGASFEMVDAKPFIWGVLATDCTFGPGAGLFLTDWVQGWGKPNKGRIYRVADPKLDEDPLVIETKKILGEGMEKRTPEELGKLLAHANMRVRQEAQFQLADRGKVAIGLLQQIAASPENQIARVHALCRSRQARGRTRLCCHHGYATGA